MASAKNKVIAGDYEGYNVAAMFGSVVVTMPGKPAAPAVNKQNVATYEVITDEHRKSAASGVARGLVGGVLLGPVGMLAGGLSAKNKGVYQVAIQWKDEKRSLIEVDDKIYKAIIKACF